MNRSLLSRFSLLSAALALPVLAASAQTISAFSPTYGRIGDSFTISGTGLATATAVQINGETMPFTVNTLAGTLTVKVPPQASTGLVRVTTPAGTATTSKGFRVTRLSTSLSFPAQAAVSGAGTAGDYSTPCIADLDDDGLLDLVIGFGVYNGANGSGTLRRYEQTTTTDGNFGTTTTGVLLTTSTVTNGVAGTKSTIALSNFAKPYITDLDGDGLLDLLIGETNGNVLLFEQANTTVFDPNNFENRGTLFPNPETTVADGYYCRPTVVDLDGDGLLDVLVGANHGKIRRYEQKTAQANTTANFTALGFLQDVTNATAVDLDGGAVTKAQVLDIEGDGILDLLVGNSDGNLLQYQQTATNAATFKRVGTGSFNGIALGGTQYAAPVMADVDGDGLMDLLVGNYAVAGNTAGGNTAGANALRYEQTNNAVATPLPVTLTSFTGSATSAGNQLRWNTTQEVNSAKFVVERSADGKTYQDIASQTAAGNSTTARIYQYLDATNLRTAYYRLRQVDADGTTAYSSVVVVTRTATAAPALVAFPNPFEGELLVALAAGTEAQPAAISISTLAGQTVYARTISLSGVGQRLPGLPSLKSGVYVLRLTTATGSSTQRIVRR